MKYPIFWPDVPGNLTGEKDIPAGRISWAFCSFSCWS